MVLLVENEDMIIDVMTILKELGYKRNSSKTRSEIHLIFCLIQGDINTLY